MEAISLLEGSGKQQWGLKSWVSEGQLCLCIHLLSALRPQACHPRQTLNTDVLSFAGPTLPSLLSRSLLKFFL